MAAPWGFLEFPETTQNPSLCAEMLTNAADPTIEAMCVFLCGGAATPIDVVRMSNTRSMAKRQLTLFSTVGTSKRPYYTQR